MSAPSFRDTSDGSIVIQTSRASESYDKERVHFEEALKNILVPRVSGTPLHSKVKEYLKTQLQSLGWLIESDIFTERTPLFGDICFENIIAKLNPNATKVVVFSCHYDSKFFPDFEFVGATDAAVPCAMLIHLARCLHNQLNALRNKDTSVEIWLFDGEEAFVEWGPTDSLYGARHLATKMEAEKLLTKIKCLILLDLLGTKNPIVFNYYKEEEVFNFLVSAEASLQGLGVLKRHHCTYFENKAVPHYVEDDHTPFLERGVPVVHVIPSSFPCVWHTSADNIDAIDMDTVHDLIKILYVFVLRYFNL